MQTVTMDDFSGGITDNHISAPPNKFQKADNLVIIKHKDKGKLLSRDGSYFYDSANPQLPTGNQRVGKLRFAFTSNTTLFAQTGRDLYYYSAGWTQMLGPTGNKPFTSSTTTSNRTSWDVWNNHIFMTSDSFDYVSKIYPNGSGAPTLRTAGLPKLASTPTVASTGGTGNNFIYRFCYSYSYTVNTITFLDEGSYVQSATLTNVGAPNTNTINVTSIPVLANGATTNWDTTAIKCEIFRTTNNGTVFYKVGEVTNGTTSYADTTSDATLQTNQLMYTEGGVVQNDIPPFAKFLTITGDNGIGWYAHVKEGSQVRKNRIRQSIPGDPDSCPASFFQDVAEDIAGISSVRGVPIVICDNAAYRLEGFFDEVGQGGINPIKISDTASCISSNSITQTLDGVYWCGRDGIYYCDGYNVQRINSEWSKSTYVSLTATAAQQSFIEGSYDKVNKRIWWTFSSSSTGVDADVCYILHLDWSISPDMPFTSASNSTHFAPSAITFDSNGYLIRGDRRGYVFQHSPSYATDLRVDTTALTSSWAQKYIPYDFRSIASELGSLSARKYVPIIILTCKNKTNLSTQIISNNDDNRLVENLSPIRFRGNLVWGDPFPVWGDDSLVWNFDGIIEQRRHFPPNSLRCSYKQVQIQNAYVNIYNSDQLTTATVDATAKTASLDSGTIFWPTDLVDYYISFPNDGYTKDFLITTIGHTVISYVDPTNSSVSGSQKWVIRGYPKNEVLNILSFTLLYEIFGITQQPYTIANSGAVGT